MKRMMAAMATMLLGASVSLLSAQEQSPHLSPVAAAISPEANGGCAGCGPACHPQGCLLRRLLIWATYCPKERVCNWTSCCNSCQYKGVVSPYLHFLNPKCFEGSGISPTFANECYRGYQGCGVGATCGHR